MAGTVTRMMLVVVTALTLAVSALGVSGGLGSSWSTPEVTALVVHHDQDGGD